MQWIATKFGNHGRNSPYFIPSNFYANSSTNAEVMLALTGGSVFLQQGVHSQRNITHAVLIHWHYMPCYTDTSILPCCVTMHPSLV